jgi:hypothetical protein
LLVIPALIDTTNAPMPARRNINALTSGPWWATNQPPAKRGSP